MRVVCNEGRRGRWKKRELEILSPWANTRRLKRTVGANIMDKLMGLPECRAQNDLLNLLYRGLYQRLWAECGTSGEYVGNQIKPTDKDQLWTCDYQGQLNNLELDLSTVDRVQYDQALRVSHLTPTKYSQNLVVSAVGTVVEHSGEECHAITLGGFTWNAEVRQGPIRPVCQHTARGPSLWGQLAGPVKESPQVVL
ncbi:hypothetical protein SKAU_G00337420 [Synaphobranchus kaupii]|uniref:Uncharacterized protein n=1 Tax=Synaphobranchus kaupii TaxID=118154 RepID=A0A9Q1EMF4_SYNKA|nr:hypothetical protein SKAU_G00337420 [Synaphobranchus kaupii]